MLSVCPGSTGWRASQPAERVETGRAAVVVDVGAVVRVAIVGAPRAGGDREGRAHDDREPPVHRAAEKLMTPPGPGAPNRMNPYPQSTRPSTIDGPDAVLAGAV